MVSERQIKANRRNARKSTGPKTRAGRERTRTNADRHGLAAVFNREALTEIEELARQFGRGSSRSDRPSACAACHFQSRIDADVSFIPPDRPAGHKPEATARRLANRQQGR